MRAGLRAAPGNSQARSPVVAIHQDQRRRMWFGLAQGGALLYDTERRESQRLSFVERDHVAVVYTGREGAVWFATENGVVSRTLFANSVTRVVLFAFAAGQSLSEHSTPRAAIVQVLSGRCEFDVNGKTHNLTAGDLLHMPPGAAHAVRAAEKFSMLLTLSKP